MVRRASQVSVVDLEHLKFEDKKGIHLIPLPAFYSRFKTDPELGLTEERARRHLLVHGPNALREPPTTPECIVFLRSFVSGFAILLWVGALLCYVLFLIDNFASESEDASNEHLILGSILIVTVLITGAFTYSQERKSSKVLDSFKHMMPQYATVIREGNRQEIPLANVVVGDLVELRTGDRVPADVRIILESELKVDNSMLTGESEAQTLSTVAVFDSFLEAKNIAFFSTMVVEGTGKGIVVATGEHTEMGKIAELTSGMAAGETPMSREIKRFVIIIAVISAFFGFTFLAMCFAIRYTYVEAIMYFIAIMVANVPEGLIVTVTMCLTLSAKRLASKNCLVKHLEAVETLGSTSVICSDKTGTLTMNMMTVAHIWYSNTLLTVGLEEPRAGLDMYNRTLREICRIAILCNKAEFQAGAEYDHPYKRKTSGDASEAALLKFTEAVIGDVIHIRRRNRKVCEIPFNSVNKYQVSIHETDDGDPRYLLVMKGAPERVVAACRFILTANGEVALRAMLRSQVKAANATLGGYGERVLGLCFARLSATQFPPGFVFSAREVNFPLQGLTFAGLISLLDPPRPGVPRAVALCRSAGIKVIMVTGDQPATAHAIAKQVGIITPGSETTGEVADRLGIPVHMVDPGLPNVIVIHGSELNDISSDELDDILLTYPEIVFARTSPTQKLTIVEGCQRLGAIVAVTGDGVNDSPALKRADIGVAMGITGTDVAKSAADMILLDDDFATIVIGVEEGRTIFDNLKKSIAYCLTSKTPEMLPFVYSICFRAPIPLDVMCIMGINMGTDLWPSISLAYENAESDIMKRKPRNPRTDNLINWRMISMTYLQIGMFQAAAGFYTYFFIMSVHGFLPPDLLGLRERWDERRINNLEDSYGQEWTFEQRKRLQHIGNAAFFISIVEMQWADLIICKTRRLSIAQQGMKNHCLTSGLLFMTVLAIFLIYTPYVNHVFNFEPVEYFVWAIPLPFAFLLLIYDELRRFWIRKFPWSFVAMETYY